MVFIKSSLYVSVKQSNSRSVANSKLEIEAKQFKIERRLTPDCQTEFGQEAKLMRKSSIFTSTRSYKENFSVDLRYSEI